MKKNIAALALAGITIISLAGCGPTTQGAKVPAASPAATASATPTPTPTQELTDMGPNYVPIRDDGTKPFGKYFLVTTSESEEVAYSKNVMVQIDKAGSFKPGEYASINGDKADRYTKYKVTVTNNHAKAEDLSAFSISATDGDAEAAQVFDGKIGSAPTTPVRSGKTVHWFVAFGDDQKDQAVSINAYLYTGENEVNGPKLIWTK